MRPNNASKDIWLWVETAIKKLKKDVHTQDANGMQAMPVLLMTQLEAVIQQITFIKRKGGGMLRAPGPCAFPLRLWPCNMQRFKTKQFEIPRRSHPVKIFVSSHFTCDTLTFFIKLIVRTFSVVSWCS